MHTEHGEEPVIIIIIMETLNIVSLLKLAFFFYIYLKLMKYFLLWVTQLEHSPHKPTRAH